MMKFLTTRKLVQHLNSEGFNVGVGQVSYALRRLKVKPLAIAGRSRLFPTSTLPVVREFFQAKRAKEVSPCSA